MKTGLTHRKSPSQERSRRMVDLILDGAARVLSERGYRGLTTNLVAAVAGVSVGSIYQYFPDKDAVIAALHARHSKQMHEVVIAVLAKNRCSGLAENIGAITRALVAAHLVDLQLHRALARIEPQGDSNEGSEIQQQVLALLERFSAQISHADLRFASWFTLCTVHALVHEAVIESPQYCNLSQLEPAVTDAVMGFLTSQRPKR
jgi:AcrR family transcriptional regulator